MKFTLTTFLLIPILTIAAVQDSITVSEGDAAPMFILRNANNQYVFLNDYCGKTLRKPYLNTQKYIVLLSFFTSYCKPCQKEIPLLHDIEKQFRSKGLKIFLINFAEDKETVLKYLSKNAYITLPVLMDFYGVWGEKYGVETVPALFIIDKEGIIRFVNRGFSGEEEFRSKIIPLLNTLTSDSLTVSKEQ